MLNQVIFVGRLISNPSVVELGDKKVAEVTIAVPRNYKNENGEYETDFIPLTIWNAIAENVCEYCKKGDLIGVKGRIESRPSTSGDELVMSVVVEKVTFLSSSKSDDE